jgi:hypothetical protein
MTSNCVWPISTSFEPASITVTSGDDAVFHETISVAADAPGGTYACEGWAQIDGDRSRRMQTPMSGTSEARHE